MMGFRFGTAINCIDGRTQEVVIEYMKQKYNIDGVDMVTFRVRMGFFPMSKTQQRSLLSEEQFLYL